MKHGFPDESLGLAFNEWEKGGKVPEGLALPSARREMPTLIYVISIA